MTESDQAVIARMSSDFAAIAAYLGRASADLRQLERLAAERPVAPAVHWPPVVAAPVPAPASRPAPEPAPSTAPTASSPRSDGWIGKVLAVAGVAVTLVGVALMLVLAAQAGILRPEVRVLAGAAIAAGLVGAAVRLRRRPGGRVGAIALAATGVAAAYIDVVAITVVYHWVVGPEGLLIAAAVAGAGLLLARRWDAESLGLLVLVPLIGLGPLVADGVTVPAIGFLLALSAVSVPAQWRRDWLGWHASRIAVGTLPLMVALVVSGIDGGRSPLLAVACAVAGLLAIGSALVLLPDSENAAAMAVLSAVGTVPVLAATLVVDRFTAAVMAGTLAAVLLAIVLWGGRFTVLAPSVRRVWSALATVATLIATVAAFDGPVAGPLLLALAVVVAVAGRRSVMARWCAVGFSAAGGLFFLAYAPPAALVTPVVPTPSVGASTLVASLLVVAYAGVLVRTWPMDWCWVTTAVVALYAVTTFSVTAGVLLGGRETGFFAGHVVATICWIAMAAAAFRHATSVPRAKRSLSISGGMAITAAAMAKLFLFDLGTLDGIFRVVVFIAVGLVLLGMGAGFTRLLTQRDDCEPIT